MRHSIIIVVVSFLLMLAGCNQTTQKVDPPADEGHNHDGEVEEVQIPQEARSELGIEIGVVQKRRLQEKLSFPGTIVPRPQGEALVGSLVGGRIVEILKWEGDRVEIGEALCRIEAPEIGAAQAEFIRAQAHYQYAQKDLERHAKLRQENITSEKSYLEKEAEAQAAQAELAAAERTLRSMGFDEQEIDILRNDHSASSVLTIKSPIAGIVVQRNVRLGQRIESDINLFHVVDLTRLWVKFSVYEKDLPYLRQGTKVTVSSQVAPNNWFEGTIVRIGQEIQPQTRQVFCFAEVTNPGGKLLPNQFVTCAVQAGMTSKPVLAVPTEAVVKDSDGDYLVYVEHEPNHFLPRPVELGTRCEHWCEVKSGISEGEKIVLKGAFFIKSEVAKGSFGHGHVH